MELNVGKIKMLLNSLGWSMADLGRALQPVVSRQAIWKVIHERKASWNMLNRLGKALSVNAKDLII